MSYKVLYRKYRPSNFNDIVDQKFITDTLKESIILNKISHAYIFSGPKGTGKTSTAKVFAKAINCENPVDGEPCNKCNSCINFDSNPDIIELDAASNNKVEDIREIINNVKLSPTSSKYKIYIIDEVHMLTNSASNAFLLTLEEPPSHAIFILATTNPESLPQTILSRCQQFAFSKISKKALIDRIKYILSQEKVSLSDEVISEIAGLSDGGLRDALSILDQLITLNKPIDSELLTEQFGIVSDKVIEDLIEYVINNDLNNIKLTFKHLREYGINEKSFSGKLISLLTNKVCDLKIQSKNNEYTKLKQIVFEIIKVDNYKSNFNYYDIIEMIIISNLDIKPDKNISQEIIFEEKKLENEDNSEKNEVTESLEISETEEKENTKEVTKIEEDNNGSLQEVNNDFDLTTIRINNSFATANLSMKQKFSQNFDKFVEKLKDEHNIYSLLLDSEVGTVSSTNVLLVTDTVASANLLNKYSDIISNKVNSDKKYVFVDKEEWNRLTQEYKKNKDKYVYIEEPKIENTNNELEKLANNIFGENSIIMEEE